MGWTLRKKQKNITDQIGRFRIVKVDLVQVISGKEKGRKGIVKKIDRKHNRVTVEGLSLIKKMVKSSEENKGQTYTKEGTLHYSTVQLVDPNDGKPCRTTYRFLEDGSKVRISVRTGAVIPKPEELKQTTKYEAGGHPRDTSQEEAIRETLDLTTLLYKGNLIKRIMTIQLKV